MRYVMEFLLPAIIAIVVALVLFRNRSNPPQAGVAAASGSEDSGTLSTGTFIVILIIGAAFTVALIYALHNNSAP